MRQAAGQVEERVSSATLESESMTVFPPQINSRGQTENYEYEYRHRHSCPREDEHGPRTTMTMGHGDTHFMSTADMSYQYGRKHEGTCCVLRPWNDGTGSGTLQKHAENYRTHTEDATESFGMTWTLGSSSASCFML